MACSLYHDIPSGVAYTLGLACLCWFAETVFQLGNAVLEHYELINNNIKENQQ